MKIPQQHSIAEHHQTAPISPPGTLFRLGVVHRLCMAISTSILLLVVMLLVLT